MIYIWFLFYFFIVFMLFIVYTVCYFFFYMLLLLDFDNLLLVFILDIFYIRFCVIGEIFR